MILDRIENDVAVLCGEDGEVLTCPGSMLRGAFREDSSFSATVREGKIVSLEPSENPSAGENRRRLEKLFKNRRNDVK